MELVRPAAFGLMLIVIAGAAGYGPCSSPYNPLHLIGA
jgi:hypothetical protein